MPNPSPNKYPYQYAVVCKWEDDVTLELGGHSGLLVFSSETPWQGDLFPIIQGDEESVLRIRWLLEDRADNGRSIDKLGHALSAPGAPISLEERAMILNFRNYGLQTPLETLRAIQSVWEKIDLNGEWMRQFDPETKNFITRCVNHSRTLRVFKPQPGVKIDQYMSSTEITAVRNVDDDCSSMCHSIPHDYMIFPARTETQPGVDIAQLNEWWTQQAQAMDAFIFKTRRCSFQRQGIPWSLESNEIPAPAHIEAEFKQSGVDYVLYVNDSYEPIPRLSLAYKDQNNQVKLHSLSKNEQALLLDSHFRYPWPATLQTKQSIPLRDAMQCIVSNIPGHTPSVSPQAYEAAKRSGALNKSSTLVYEALDHSGVTLKPFISTPTGLMKDCHQLQGKYSTDLFNFVSACVHSLERDDRTYSNKNTEKLNAFRGIQTDLTNMINQNTLTPNAMEKIHERVKTAAAQHRGSFSIGDPQTYRKYKEFLKAHPDHETPAKGNTPGYHK